MSKKKKKSTAADNLIESLMDDLKDIQAESSYRSGHEEDNFEGLPTLDADDHRVDKTNIGGNMWDQLEQGLEKDIEVPEFSASSESSDEELGENTSGSDFEMPEGFGDLPPSERFMVGTPSVEENSVYKGPSMDGGYQSPDDLFSPPSFDSENFGGSESSDEATRPVMSGEFGNQGEDKTVSIQQDFAVTSTAASDAEKTVAVDGFANARVGARKNSDVDVKVSVGSFRGSRGAANVMTSVDASLAQAENLKIAQQRILELEKEVEQLRADNEELASAGEIIQSRADDLGIRITALEKEKSEIQESAHSELLILKGNLQYKENEVSKARLKVDELETRLKSDFKKIRVRERELENRLELLRAEKSALVRSKDEYILEQKRKIDQLSQELDNYRKKCLELNKTIEANQDQVKRTERALRLALSNLEAKEENLVPLKKAE